jgi:penicillin-binding protein 1C
MPPGRQGVLLDAEGAADARWRLDGADLGPATPSRLWSPTPGAHVLELVSASDHVYDRVEFDVRGHVER